MEREKWSGRLSFILASIGSAVGLGNAWRFALVKKGFRYDVSYDLYAEIIGGWIITFIIFISGFIINFICKRTKKGKELLLEESKEKSWEEIKD